MDLMGYRIPDYVKRIYPQKVILLQLEELCKGIVMQFLLSLSLWAMNQETVFL